MKTAKARILVVEDDHAILKGLLDVFVFNGFEAAGFEDGGLGMNEALEQNYDLIILDMEKIENRLSRTEDPTEQKVLE